jgi:hypothetical protein
MTHPAAPRVHQLALPALDTIGGHRVGADDALDELRIELREGDADWPGLHLRRCEVRLAGMGAVDLTGARLVQTRSPHVELASLRLVAAHLRTVELLGGRIGDLDAAGGRWESVRIEALRVGYLSLRGATASDLLLVGAQVDTLDLSGARAQRLALVDCTVGELLVREAQLTDVDLRGARLGRVEGVAGLAGAVVAPSQLLDLAPQLAAGLGLLVAAPQEGPGPVRRQVDAGPGEP